jgi:hypothetical protein
MKHKKLLATAVILSGGIGLGAQAEIIKEVARDIQLTKEKEEVSLVRIGRFHLIQRQRSIVNSRSLY